MAQVITSQPVLNSTFKNEENKDVNGVELNSLDPDALSEREKERRRRQQQCCCHIDEDADFCCVSFFRCTAYFFQAIGECTDQCCDTCASCLHICCENDHQDTENHDAVCCYGCCDGINNDTNGIDTDWGNNDTNYNGGVSGGCCGEVDNSDGCCGEVDNIGGCCGEVDNSGGGWCGDSGGGDDGGCGGCCDD